MSLLGACLLVLIAPASAALAAAAGAESVVATLARGGRVSCRPVLPYYCENIHIGCAGRTTISARPFTLAVEEDRVSLIYQARGSQTTDPVRAGRIAFADELSYAIVRLGPSADYVRINADGTYSFRLYLRGLGNMSYGSCR